MSNDLPAVLSEQMLQRICAEDGETPGNAPLAHTSPAPVGSR
jgi:hypothetical protein